MNETILYIFLGVCIYYAALITFGIWIDYEKLKLEKDKNVNGVKGRDKNGRFTSLK
jgi:hypothetical protein